MQTGTGFCSVLTQRERRQAVESPGQMGKVNEGNGPTGGAHQRPRDLRNGAEVKCSLHFLGGAYLQDSVSCSVVSDSL